MFICGILPKWLGMHLLLIYFQFETKQIKKEKDKERQLDRGHKEV